MMAEKTLEQNDPVYEMYRLLEEWGKLWKDRNETGFKPASWVVKKGGVTPMISEDEARVVDSVVSALMLEDKDAWLAIKLYYAKQGTWTHQRIAKTIKCRKQRVGHLIEIGVYFIADRYPKRAKEIFDNAGTRK